MELLFRFTCSCASSSGCSIIKSWDDLKNRKIENDNFEENIALSQSPNKLIEKGCNGYYV